MQSPRPRIGIRDFQLEGAELLLASVPGNNVWRESPEVNNASEYLSEVSDPLEIGKSFNPLSNLIHHPSPIIPFSVPLPFYLIAIRIVGWTVQRM